MLRITGFKTYSAFIDETTPLERQLLVRSVEQWHAEQDGGGGGAVPGAGPSEL
jgi:hypothetical protein